MSLMHQALVAGSLLLALIAARLAYVYDLLPLKELKHRARAGDPLAGARLPVAAYPAGTHLFLRGLMTLALATAAAEAARRHGVLAVMLIAPIVVAAILGASRLTMDPLSLRLAAALSPRLAPLAAGLNRLAAFVKSKPRSGHTGVYDAADFGRWLERQAAQPDSRLTTGDLLAVQGVIALKNLSVGDFTTALPELRILNHDDAVGPVLLDELYRSGRKCFLVKGSDGQPTGTVWLGDLAARHSGGRVGDSLRPGLFYLHRDMPADQALGWLAALPPSVAVVLDDEGQFVGATHLSAWLEGLLAGAGAPPIDLSSAAAVANWRPDQPQPQASLSPEQEPAAT